MKKLLKIITGVTLSLAMAIGVGIGFASNNKKAEPVYATAVNGSFNKYSGALTEGDYVVAHGVSKALTNTTGGGRINASSISVTNNAITNPDESIVWHIAASGDYWTIFNSSTSKYAASTGAKNKGQLLDSGTDDMSLWSCTSAANSTSYDFVNKKNTANSVNATLRYNSGNADNNGPFATYATGTGEALTLYKKAANVAVTGVSVSPTSVTLGVGATQQLTPAIAPNSATNKNVSYSSNATGIATVSDAGLITAISAGNAIITVTTADGDFTATCSVTVTAPVSVSGVTLNKSETSIEIGSTETLVAAITPIDASNKSVNWTSNNEGVATVSGGIVTAQGAGEATITVTTVDGNFTATCDVTVTIPSSVTFIAGTDIGSTNANNTPDSLSKCGFDVEGTNAAFATSEYRIYAGSEITFSVSSGYISQITIVKNGSYNLSLLSLKGGELGAWNNITGIWTGFSTSVTFVASAQFRADSFSIERVDSIPAKALSSIALSGTYPTSFAVNDAFSHEGMIVTATYNDGSDENVTASAVFSGYDMSNAGNQTVTVSYTEDDVTKTATYSISIIVVVPEPAVAERSLSDFKTGENTKTVAYLVTAEIKNFKTGDTKDAYGNMTLTDGENDLIIYGATMNSSALAWNNTDTYVFTNPQNFMTNETSNALAVGMLITMKLIRCDYNVTIEGQGIITKIHASSISLNNTDVNLLVGGTTTLTATIAPSISNSTYTWESSDESVATVDNGVVTGVAEGTATITAKVSESVKAICSVTVGTVATPNTYLSSASSSATLNGKENKLVFANLGLNNDEQYSDPFVCGDFSVVFGGGGNNGKYYTTGSGIRTYGGGTITISSAFSISKITFVWSGDSYKPTANVANLGNYNNSTGVWTGTANSIIFTRPSGSGHWRLQSIEVKFESNSTYVSSIAMRFGASIPKSDWDAINEHDGWTITDYGVMLMKETDKTSSNYSSVEDAFNKHASSSVLKDIHKCQNETPFALPQLDENAYIFTVKVNFPNDSQYFDDVIYATPYIVVNGEDYYFLTEMSESVQSLAGKSVSGVDTTLSSAALNLLSH